MFKKIYAARKNWNEKDPQFESHLQMFTVMPARWQVGGSGFRRRHGGPRFHRFRRVVLVVVLVVILVFAAIVFSFCRFKKTLRLFCLVRRYAGRKRVIWIFVRGEVGNPYASTQKSDRLRTIRRKWEGNTEGRKKERAERKKGKKEGEILVEWSIVDEGRATEANSEVNRWQIA